MTSEPTYVAVANLSDFGEGALKMARVGNRRICLVRLSTGVHALDNACPHEGYGLTQGDLAGDQLTCVWHNWKFRVTDGHCTQGEENVTSHRVRVDADGTISVALHLPEAENQRPKLLASLRSGIERNYVGQISRDVIRLLKASANPGELVWEAVAFGAPRSEFGWGHSIASATDALAMAELYEGDQKALPIVQAIAGISESERSRPVEHLPDPISPPASGAEELFRSFVETEQLEKAQSLLRGGIHDGRSAKELQRWFTNVVSDHHLSYGHGAIYVQKAFELLTMIGWERADTVLPYLVPTIVYGTREDKLPYMRPFMKNLARVDLAELAAIPTSSSWDGRDGLVDELLGRDRSRAFEASINALRQGSGVHGILDAAVLATSERLLRYDTSGERDFLDDFNWLDITHGITYAHAARWHYEAYPGPDTVRLALFATFLAFWTGRHEWHSTIGQRENVKPLASDLLMYADLLQRAALQDPAAALIVQAHAIKTSRAAAIESLHLNSPLPLLATQRFMEGPKQERFVAATVARSLAFLNGKSPRDHD
jgi:nitrite reductase/ring-hydroxylating ferredoxin subunit